MGVHGRQPGQTLGQELTSLSLWTVPAQLPISVDKCMTPRVCHPSSVALALIPASMAHLMQPELG